MIEAGVRAGAAVVAKALVEVILDLEVAVEATEGVKLTVIPRKPIAKIVIVA